MGLTYRFSRILIFVLELFRQCDVLFILYIFESSELNVTLTLLGSVVMATVVFIGCPKFNVWVQFFYLLAGMYIFFSQSLNSHGKQFRQYQQSQEPPLISTHCTQNYHGI